MEFTPTKKYSVLEMADEQTSAAENWPVSKVRSTFIDFFVKKHDHVFFPSSPVVPVNDPTLLFANSGMTQFKPMFLGTCDPALAMSKLTMAANTQKCIRAGGKHNDLEDVGKDVYHHTFFEMLGNWSFGAYFKQDAIDWAWECLTVEFGLDPNRLYASYFGGDAAQGLPADEEARVIWLKFLPTERVLPFGAKENFWEMGPTGPCGPCSEIHYDRLGNRDASKLVNADLPDVIEIWNIVFMQFNRETDGSLRELPNKHVDTGMGLERLTSVLQHKPSNYDTDVFMPIFASIKVACGCREYTGLVGADDKDLVDMAYRVVADHIRTLTFAITDGAVPASEGRGYVLRRILRRAVRYGQEILGAPAGFFTSLVPVVVDNFSVAFPELLTRKELVMGVISEEEMSFNRTLDQGVKHFKKVVAQLKAQGSTVVPAKDAHILFTSMGFPLDLTQLMAAELHFTVDVAGFDELMERDRSISERAEQLRKGGGAKDMGLEAEQTAWLISNNVPTTDTADKYNTTVVTTKALAVFTGRGQEGAGFRDSVEPSEGTVGLILEASPFYYESGGQIYDTGRLRISGAVDFIVENVQTYAGYVVHVGYFHSGEISVGNAVEAHVDYERRSLIAPNHTMTHVLNYALRTVLLEAGTNSQGMCEQKGSLVDAEKLRFDFSWSGALTAEQVQRVEELVVRTIRADLDVDAVVVPLGAASGISGLRCVFGEKYPDPVRVISVGVSVEELLKDPTNPSWTTNSIEFCGGTHLTKTSAAEDFVLFEESGIAKGIRRISAYTRKGAAAARAAAASLLARLTALEAAEPGPELVAQNKAAKLEVDQAVVSLVDKEHMRRKLALIAEKLKVWNKAQEAVQAAAATETAQKLAAEALAANKNVIVTELEYGRDGKILKKIQEAVRAVHEKCSVLLASYDAETDKITINAILSKYHESVGGDARKWCDHCTQTLGSGKGGGKADLATASLQGGGAITIVDVLRVADEYSKQFLEK